MAGLEFAKFLWRISCEDYRLMKGPRSTKYYFVQRIRELAGKGVLYVRHLSFLKPLSIGASFKLIRDSKLAKLLASDIEITNELLDSMGFPGAYLVVSLSLLSDGSIAVTWVRPPGVEDEIPPDASHGWRVPIQTCLPPSSPVEKLGARLNELLAIEPIKPKTPILAYTLIAILDKHRLVGFNELRKLAYAAMARDLPRPPEGWTVKWRLVHRYYHMLSEANVLGRYLVLDKDRISKHSVYVETEPRCARLLYGFLAATRSAGHMLYSDDKVAASAVLSGREINVLIELLSSCDTRIVSRTLTLITPFPWELYDPLEDRWYSRPTDALVKLSRYTAVRKQQ